MKNKKGLLMFDMLAFIPKLIFLTIVVFSIVVLITLYIKTEINITSLESEQLIYRVVYGQGITLENEIIQRNYPMQIDIERFNEKTLAEMFQYPDEEIIAMRLSLYDHDGGKIKDIYLNKEWFEKLEPRAGMPGTGGAQINMKTLSVTIVEELKREKGHLKIEVVMPNA